MGHRRRREADEVSGLPATYEGPEVLTALLVAAGSPHTAEEVAKRFAAAQQAGEERSEAVPALFPDEPRFATPEEARRLYSNLFGLWDRIAAGFDSVDDAPEVVMAAKPMAPIPRGTLTGEQLTSDLVEFMWRHLASLPERELSRLRDRFEGTQPNLTAWMDQVALPEVAMLSASDLAFEGWAMFDHAFGDRLEAADWETLNGMEAEPPPLESTQPALALYVDEQLDNLADEDPHFSLETRAQVERALATVMAALTQALEESSVKKN